MKPLEVVIIIALLLSSISVVFSQPKSDFITNKNIGLRERLALTKDNKGAPGNDYLVNRLGCPFKPVVDEVTIIGKIENNSNDETDARKKLKKLGQCDEYENESDEDFTFNIIPKSQYRNLVWDYMGFIPYRIHSELVNCARNTENDVMFPGWRESGKNSVLFKELNSDQLPFSEGGEVSALRRWMMIKKDQCVSVRGALVIDSGEQCKIEASRQLEIHPVYEIKLLEDSFCNDTTEPLRKLQTFIDEKNFPWEKRPEPETIFSVSDNLPKEYIGQKISYTISVDSYYNVRPYRYKYKILVNDKVRGFLQTSGDLPHPVGDDEKTFRGILTVPKDGRVDIRLTVELFDNGIRQLGFTIYNSSITTSFR